MSRNSTGMCTVKFLNAILISFCSVSASAVDPFPEVTGKVYTTSWFGGVVSVVDTRTWEMTGTIPVGKHNHNIIASPNRKSAWVTNNNAGTISVIDTQTDEVIRTLSVGNGPRHTFFSPDGLTAYVTNEFDDAVAVVDPVGYRVSSSLPVGSMPHFPIVVGERLFVTNFGNGQLSALNRESGLKLASLDVGTGPLGAGMTKDLRRVYVACHTSNHVAVIDVEGLSIVARIPTNVGPVQVTVAPNQEFAYVANDGDGTVQKIDLAKNEVIHTIEIAPDAGSHGITFAADGRVLLVTNTGSDTLSVIDTELDEVVKTVKVAAAPEGLAYIRN